MNLRNLRPSRTAARWAVLAAPALLAVSWFGIARAQALPSTCFEGSSLTPYVQPVAFAPSPPTTSRPTPRRTG